MKSKGFSLIELMVVIGIMGGLMAFAIPTYKDYIVKAKVATLLHLIEPCQNALKEYMIATNKIPDSGVDYPSSMIATNQLAKACWPQVSSADYLTIRPYSSPTYAPQIEIIFQPNFYPEGGATNYMLWVRMDTNAWTTNQQFKWGCRAVTYNTQLPLKFVPKEILPCP